MSSAYPQRRIELAAYEEDIMDISNYNSTKLYDYHKLFSAINVSFRHLKLRSKTYS